MILGLHIVIALASLVASSYIFFKPSQQGLSLSAWLTAATLSSGTLLAVLQSGRLVHVCVSGLIYTAITLALMLSARHKLAHVLHS